MFYAQTIEIQSEGRFYSTVLTEQVASILESSGIVSGVAVVTLHHTTSCLLLLEHEAGILVDIQQFIKRIMPADQHYFHHDRGVDRNGEAHVLNALFNSSVVIPVSARRLVLGEYQDLVFMDFQSIAKSRSVGVYLYGESR